MIYKYCRRCGKRLKGEENRLRGYGKTCFAKVRASTEQTPLVPHQLTLFKEIDRANERGSRGAREQSRGAEQENPSKAEQSKRGQGRAEQSKSKKQSKGETPHLEKTLTPTYKKPLLFTPHTHTPTHG